MDETGPVPLDDLLTHRAWVARIARALVRGAAAGDLEQGVWLSAMTRPPRHSGSLRGRLGTLLRRAEGGAVPDATVLAWSEIAGTETAGAPSMAQGPRVRFLENRPRSEKEREEFARDEGAGPLTGGLDNATPVLVARWTTTTTALDMASPREEPGGGSAARPRRRASGRRAFRGAEGWKPLRVTRSAAAPAAPVGQSPEESGRGHQDE